MSKWTLIGNSSTMSICIGGPEAYRSELLGRGKLELSIGELREKGASDSCLASIEGACTDDVSCCIVDDIALIKDWLRDRYAMGHERANAGSEIVDAIGDSGAGLLTLGDHPYVIMALPLSEYERFYRLVESAITTKKGSGFQFALEGEFDVGVDKIHEHRPTPEQLVTGAPLVSKWTRIWVHSGTEPENTA